MRRRLRPMVIGSRRFVWTAEIFRLLGGTRYARVRVWGNGKASRVLQVDLEGRRYTDLAPTPLDVRTIIEYALSHGWDPASQGVPFVLTGNQHASSLVLEHFVPTDRLKIQIQR